MTMEKLNKIFIGVIVVTVFAYILNIVDLSFFANDFTQITSQIQMIAGFIPDQEVQNINSVIDIMNNTAGVVRSLLVTISVLSGLATVIGLFIVKVFADRVTKYKTFFGYSGLIITAGATLYMQYRLFPSFNGLVSMILIAATMLIMIMSIIYIVIGAVGIYRVIMSDDFRANQLAFDFAKVLSFIFVFYTVAIIATRISLYMSVVVLVKEIDLAALIDVMNYINIDWESYIPQAILSTGIVSNDSINLVVNNLADQYVLSYASTFIQNLILNLSSSVIFNNIVAYVSGFAAGVGILYTAQTKFDYKNYVAIALMVTVAVIGFVYIGGLIINLLAIGFVVCIALICL
ncbi:MAG: hypothetical protein ACK5NK_12675, partial [Niabella sp.]